MVIYFITIYNNMEFIKILLFDINLRKIKKGCRYRQPFFHNIFN